MLPRLVAAETMTNTLVGEDDEPVAFWDLRAVAANRYLPARRLLPPIVWWLVPMAETRGGPA